MEEPPSGFLPPEPPGPEPELGRRPVRSAPPAPHASPAQPFGPPRQAPSNQAPPTQAPGWPAQAEPAWQPAPAWAGPHEPDNGPAVSGFVLSMVGAALLVLLLGPLSLICAIIGIVLSRRGMKKVERGETRKHAGLAKAGYISGIITTAIAALVTVAEIVLLVAILTDEELRRDFEDEFDDGGSGGDNPISAPVRMAAPLVRLALDGLA